MLESSSKVDLGVVGDENDPSSWRPIGDYGSGRIGVGNRPPPPPTIPGRFRLQNKRDELWKTVTTEEGDPVLLQRDDGRGRVGEAKLGGAGAGAVRARLPLRGAADAPPAPPAPGALPDAPPAPPVPEPPPRTEHRPLLDGGAAGAAGARRPLRRVRARARPESAPNPRDAPAGGGAAGAAAGAAGAGRARSTALDLPPRCAPPPPGY